MEKPERAPYTLALIKPDAFSDGHVGKILTDIERAEIPGGLPSECLRLAHVRMWYMTEEQASAFYAEHRFREYFKPLVSFITSGPLMSVVMWTTSPTANVVKIWRDMMGPFKVEERRPGTIRAKYASRTDDMRNAVHGSDSHKAADREIGLLRSYGILSWAEVEHLQHGAGHAR